jgi:hypothetical protein
MGRTIGREHSHFFVFTSIIARIQLRNNRFHGQLNEFVNVSSYQLDTLDFSHNNLEWPIPMAVFELQGLEGLSLYSNNSNG